MNIRRTMYAIRRRLKWSHVLVGLSVFGFLLNVIIFYPGHMSGDSLAFLYQALGVEPFDSLRPVSMSLIWSGLIGVTGKVSSMLLLQQALLWFSSFLIALYFYKIYNNRLLSLILLLIPALPYVFNVTGVIWTDVLHAGLMLFSVALSLWLGKVQSRSRRIGVLIVVISALIVAITIRYNTIPAVIPIILLALHRSSLISGKRVTSIAAIGVVAVGVLIVAIAPIFLSIKNVELVNGPKIDDIANMSSRERLEMVGSKEAREYLLKIYDCAEQYSTKLNIIHLCKTNGVDSDVFLEASRHAEGIQYAWKEAVAGSPLQYIQYKIAMFTIFLFPADQSRYIWHGGIDNNSLGLRVKNPFASYAVGTLINNFFYKYFKFLYEPWFWLVLSVGILCVSLRAAWFRRDGMYMSVMLLALSSILVIVSYFPTGATVDYRYILWPAISSTLAFIILFTAYRAKHGDVKRKK